MILKQTRTYRDGTTWLRWVETADRPDSERRERAPRLPAGWNCASCRPDDRDWTDAPAGMAIPKVDLIYDCTACGCATYQGRVAH